MKKIKGPKPLFENGKLPVNKAEVVFNSTFYEIPDFYEDKAFKCKRCGKEEVWTAKQQKWWYEEAKGDLETTAVLCRECRDFKKHQRDLQKKHENNKT
ncbi:MAG: zinc-ribbon domain-containing protein [Candidatus Thiodiazotropha endolucinida]|nr:zinc-ribbon domain-containing protein [Candidatus Thiodiazotropha taylori]MCG8055557.1 zinc-ribbon domain-containing protein [Candidatus Thiodiazotropha taylori]MCW4315084.1 zinc-ribbon domain-containing protein [Candidatus Thiodiazotropha taylori]MCW4317385.1 zinc-ribbon domain-containing protein [Candidatus Thiodiazotropha taylori]